MVRSGPLPSTKRKRKSDNLIWAQDGDNEKAQEHPAYLLEIDEDGAPSSNNDNDQAFYSSNGTTAQVPKSRISSTGLATRRQRNNNNNWKGSGGDNIETSTSVSNKSIKVANESAKSKDEMYEGKTGVKLTQSNDDDTDADIALTKLKEQSTAVPSPVASSQLKQEGLYDDDTDEDIAPDTVKSAQVKTEEDVYGEETDEEDGKAAAVLSTAISSNNTNVETDDDDSDSDDESDVDEEAKTIARWDASNEEFNKSAKVYLWCEGKGRDQYGKPPGYGGLVLLPYNWYLFYEKLKRCKTWGDIRTLCDDDTYQTLVDRYERKCYSDEELTDRKSVCMDDFDLSEHESYGDLTAVGMFPPVLEQVMWGAAINLLPCAGNKFLSFRGGQHNVNPHSWMLDLGNAEGTWYEEQWLKFDSGEKDEIFKKIEELGCTVRYFPKLGKKFTSVYEM